MCSRDSITVLPLGSFFSRNALLNDLGGVLVPMVLRVDDDF